MVKTIVKKAASEFDDRSQLIHLPPSAKHIDV